MSLRSVPPDGILPPEPPIPQSGSPARFVFMNAWQGGTESNSAPLIHSKLLGLRREIKSLAAKKTPNVPFPVRGAKDLAQKLADALNKLELIAPVVDQKITHLPTGAELVGVNKSGAPAYRSLVHVVATVRVIAPDGSFVDMVGSGHGADSDDKAGGKASTYAWKDALLKGLTIPDQDMIDTDDTAGDEPRQYDARTAADSRAVLNQLDKGSPTKPGFDYALAKIAEGTTLADMDVIKLAITTGEIALTHDEKVKASVAYAAKRKLIKGD